MRDYLALFPLNVVLFPGMLLPLHIFEERYKEMIGECLQAKSPFGVLYAHDDRVETIGCTAEISQVITRYTDGRLDIVAAGQKRFQVSFFDSERSYLRGSVELLPDSVEDQEPAPGIVEQVLELFGEASKLMGHDASGELSGEPSHYGLAFRIGSILNLQNQVRQRLLEARSEDQRLEELAEHLSELLPRLAERHKSAKQAGSNGKLL